MAEAVAEMDEAASGASEAGSGAALPALASPGPTDREGGGGGGGGDEEGGGGGGGGGGGECEAERGESLLQSPLHGSPMRGSLGRPLRRKSRRPRRESKAWPLDDYGPLDLPSDIAVCRHLPASPHISPHLPTSPHISPCLFRRRGLQARPLLHDRVGRGRRLRRALRRGDRRVASRTRACVRCARPRREAFFSHPPSSAEGPAVPRWLARGPGRSESAPFTPRGVNRWQCSPHMTALWSLGAVSLANTLMMCPGYDEARGTRCSQSVHRPPPLH